MMKATRKITKLRVNEVSLVGEGDNPHADVLILKHRQIVGVDFIVAKQRLEEVREGALSIAKALSEGGSPMDIQELQDKLGQIEKSLETAQTEAETSKGRITELESNLAAVTKERDEAIEKAKKLVAVKKDDDEDGTDDDVMKNLPENVRALITKERTAREELELSISKERDERAELVEIEKVRATGLKDADKFGKLLHRVRKGKSTPEDADTLSDFLAKAKAIGDGGKLLFETIGKVRGTDGSDGEDVDIKVNEMVDAVMKAKPMITRAAAYTEVMDANPALYDQVQKAKRAA